MNLLAQIVSRKEYLDSMQNRFSQPETDLGGKLLALVVLLVATFLIFALINRIQKRKVDPNVEKPYPLFFKAMRRMKLSWSDRWRLWRMAGSLELEHPTALLISRSYFETAIQEFCGRESLLGSRESARRPLTALRDRLFTSPGERPQAATAPAPAEATPSPVEHTAE